MERGKNQISEGEADSVEFGDVIYVKLRSGSWWPAQVVDDKSILSSLKPRNRRAEDVLVRIYGSHTFLNVNPVRSCAEFETILKNNNGDLRKILEEGLEKDLPSSKKSASKAKGTSSAKKRTPNKKEEEQTTAKRQKGNDASKDDDQASPSPSCETASGKLQELSSRRIRVMQSLGLSAPSGSPFIKVRSNYNTTP
ncbi:uncharacterized protein LOC123917619 isoform X1 [Trifolium pratense]|uniref:uncharacterized protein LOC123917619 isoform X1 n=1 Tax=Trifolium pratense TaxID=57577 RepID=UPI001E693A14|nr:uncharacterized protein LOC123917619 isoform X1 [Trifolium pratense]